MWELIAENKRKSFILFVALGGLLGGMGAAFGRVLGGPEGALAGLGAALLVWLVLSFVSYNSGQSLLLGSVGAAEIAPEAEPRLFNIIEEIKIAANLPAMPKVDVIPEASPNAFATGVRPDRSAVAVTAGLLERMNRDELQGVIAHEISHILNRDVLTMTFAGVMLCSIQLLADTFWRSMRGGSSVRYRSSRRSGGGGGSGQGVFLLVALVLMIVGPVLARLFYFAISRRREYLADASAARLTRYPEGLASALEKLASYPGTPAATNAAVAPMYILSPKELTLGFSTHPPIEERIRILRALGGGVSFASYQRAFTQVTGRAGGVLPASSLVGGQEIPVRPPSPQEPQEREKASARRSAGDWMRAIDNFAFLTCACGLRIKVPPEFSEREMACPRCGAVVPVPRMAGRGEVLKTPGPPLEYVRKAQSWESVTCSCGKGVQIAPAFCGTHVVCRNCGRKIWIRTPETASS